MKKVALDVDGVLADFYLAMCQRFNMPYETIYSWDSDWIAKHFKEIENDELFWSTLPQLSPPEAITFEIDCYMTALPAQMREARIYWLSKLGYPDKPVVVSYDKLSTCLELGIDILVDDKPATVEQFFNYKKESQDRLAPTVFQFLPYYASSTMAVPNAYIIRHLDDLNRYL